MYCCPKCKGTITNWRCPSCGWAADAAGRVPIFYTESVLSQAYRRIANYYDMLYENAERPWSQIAGRGEDFERYFACLISENGVDRYLDIGCGQGHLVFAVHAHERCGIDISQGAVQEAAGRADCDFCVGIAEELPYPTGYFDRVSSVGVMTHFLDDLAATREVHRVLSDEGKYVVGIYLPPGPARRVLEAGTSLARFLSRPRRWRKTLRRRLGRPGGDIVLEGKNINGRQPVEIQYSRSRLNNVFTLAGFAVERVISKSNTPSAPLPNPNFRIYILRKSAAA